MTPRETVSLTLVLAGDAALAVAAAGARGRWAGLAVAGGLAVATGLLLGVDTDSGFLEELPGVDYETQAARQVAPVRPVR